MMDDKEYQQLKKKSRLELVAMAGGFEPPLSVKRTWNKVQLASAIRARQIVDAEVKQKQAETEAKAEAERMEREAKAVQTEPTTPIPPNEEFETACSDPEPIPVEATPVSPGDEADADDDRSTPPTREMKLTAACGLTIGFSALWANRVGVPEVKLTEDESLCIAEPLVDLLDLFCPKVSRLGVVMWNLGIGCVSVAASRVMIINAARSKNAGETG